MSDAWTWRYEDAEGTEASEPTSAVFPTQSDAETWLGEEWRALLGSGVEAVVLLENGEPVYGPMSLRPAE